ncbi:phage tail tip lysozyme [Bradyrhizobium commune]|uniref:Phage tail lysozyme domain-containing protein n=1 Tax=Bradyrhizobium commune TaxID=83627 RepID=A0A7S9GYR8_9BRAD|nr:phage tail tip lysozyme [Bradyrhizobium commune]QPF91200.1 hypothetical protein IC761_32900 [Bradyrhizobium commune]
MAIIPADFAKECIIQGIRFGIHPHYIVGAAQLRSGISDQTVAGRIGPFRLTQVEWNANCFDEGFGISDFEADDVNIPEMQSCIYALMALRAQGQFLERSGRLPSAAELFQEQWPNSGVQLPADLQAALDQTKALMAPAFAAVPDAPQSPATIDAGDISPSPPVDRDKPVGAKGTETFVAKAPGIMQKLIADFNLKDFQAAGIMGNIGEECDGFREMQEKKPIKAPGGLGWAQWTGSRRTLFEAFCTEGGLSPLSDAANYGFLKRELQTTQSASLTAVQKTASISKAVRSFEASFERARAGLEHFDRRDEWADLALKSFRNSAPDLVPSAVAQVLDPDLNYRVIAHAALGGATFWAVDQFTENGGQVLVKLDGNGTASVLASDTTIFPLQSGLVPAPVLAQLSADFDATAVPAGPGPAPVGVQPPATDNEVCARIFAKAKECDDTLVTRDVPHTNHGRVACAFAVNNVVEQAIGHPVGGGLSTAAMGDILAKSLTPAPEGQITAGMIIISPTHGSNVGHVGIVGEVKDPINKTVIYSNSSSKGVFSHSFTFGSWKNFYRDRKNLPVFLYALKK